MRKLTLYPEEIPTTTRAILYTFHDENDVMSMSLEAQEKVCKEYITSQNWILEREFSDSCPYATKVMDRIGITNLLHFVDYNNFEKYCIVLYSSRVLGSCLRSVGTFIKELEENEMNILTVEDKISAENGSGLFALHVGANTNIFFHKILNEIHLVFATDTSNIELDTYKGSCMVEDQLRKVLSACVNDNYVQIRCLSDVKNYWEYKAETTISSEIDTCVKLFFEHLVKSN